MAQEQDEFLDKGDLHEHEAEADRQEVAAGSPFGQAPHGSAIAARPRGGLRPGAPPQDPERDHDQQQCQGGGLQQRGHQHRIAPFQQGQAALRLERQQFRQRAPLEEMEEVRPVVSGGPHVEFVAGQEAVAFGAEQGLRGVEEVGLVQHVVAIRLGGLDAGIVFDVEGAGVAEAGEGGKVRCTEFPVLDHQRGRLPATDQRQPPGWLGHASAFHGGHGGGEQFGYVARRQRDPARDRKQAAGPKMAQVALEGLHGIEIAFGERVQSGR
ncbi:hypothetical protein D9M72_317220 [compost metagenome]